METKDSSSSCSDSGEKEIQQLQKQAQILKEDSINSFKALKTTIQYSIEKCIAERKLHDQKTIIRLNERKLQMQECKLTVVQAFDANLVATKSSGRESTKQPKEFVDSSVYKESSGTGSGTQNVSNSSGNECSIKENEISVSGNENSISENKSSKPRISSSISGNATKADKKEHPEQPESVNDTYLVEQDDTNTTPDSSYMSNNGREADQYDDLEKKVNWLLL
ncbi:hypothetical protein Tco_0217017 [Tanacetum coccineum]